MKLRVFIGQNARLTLPISQEVDTPGFVAADTHLHTYSFSGHGDASLDERIFTLAGEGVELAIATDHNHFTDYKPQQAMRFYGIIVAATLTGVLLDWSHLDPIKALFWSAVLNGLAAVPIMAAMMVLASRRAVMGRFVERRGLLLFGWSATAVMAAASAAMVLSLVA